LGQWSQFHSYLQVDLPPTTTIVLIDGIIGPNNPLLTSFEGFAEVREFRPLSRDQVQAWIRARVMLGGDAISPNAVVLLQQLLGNDLWNVSHELEKLTLYTQGSRRVEVDDVRLLVYAERATNVFRFVDAVFGRKYTVAMESLRGLLEDGATASYLLGMLGRQVRLLFQAQEALSEGLTQEQVGTRVGLTSEFPLRLLIDQARGRDPGELLAFHGALLEADLALKRGVMAEATALELVVGQLSGIGTRNP
jgi:DNA polymerase-3 subunit delta